jgi:uncharacterized protein YjbI with pentapeptide repeats
MAAEQLPWEQCKLTGCIGVRLPTAAWCLAHAAEQAPDAFDAELKRINAEGTVDARGVVISAGLLARLLAATPRKDDRPTFTGAQFDQATFQGRAGFDGATFQGRAGFDGASFQGEAGFARASFQGKAGFDDATFKGRAVFNGASFQAEAGFDQVTFKDRAWFRGASFQGEAGFDRVSFQGWAGFREATFKGEAGFREATFKDWAVFNGASFQAEAGFDRVSFQGWAGFRGASFQGEIGFRGASFQGGARFDGVTFETAREFGPVLVRRQLVFDTATFKQRARIEAAAATLCARRAQFPSGVQLWLRWAEVVLDEADLAAPSILTGVVDRPFAGLDEQRFARVWERRPPERHTRARPRLLSVRRADVAGLAVSNVDLRPCRFVGAHNLDKLRIEGELELAAPPGGWRRGWRWTRRRVLADEHHWRYAQQQRRKAALERSPLGALSRRLHRLLLRQPVSWSAATEPRWYKSTTRPPDWLDDVKLLESVEIAALYRTLRKGREDGKDEPGAADFYYGEMEMRRHSRRELVSRSWQRGHPGGLFAAATEYVILWWYWLISGYGLRATGCGRGGRWRRSPSCCWPSRCCSPTAAGSPPRPIPRSAVRSCTRHGP